MQKRSKKIETVLSAAGITCRTCVSCKERDVMMPICRKHEAPVVNRWHHKSIAVSRFCYDVRLDENACGWRARSYERLVIKESTFTGAKYSDD